MKKIIAAAVATAFVAPAFAADVTITGSIEYAFAQETDNSTAATPVHNDSTQNESSFTIKASEELANGISVAADYVLRNTGEYTGNSLTIGRADFGTFDIGDTSGAIDTIDDKADVFYVHDNGTGTTSVDAALSWKLPTLVDNLSIVAAYSPADATTDSVTVFDVDQFQGDTQVSSGLNGLSLSYKISDTGVSVGYGEETIDADDVENKLFNVVYSANGIKLAYENGESTNGITSVTTEQTTIAGTYTMGDMVLKVGSSETSDNTGTTADITAYGVAYNLGSLVLFAEQAEDDKGDTDELTAVGAAWKF